MKLFGSIKELVAVVFRLTSGKEVRVTSVAQTGGSVSPAVAVEIEIPDVGASGSDTLVTAGAVQTLTNKTIDANGTGNSITNLEEADFQTKLADANKVLTRDASGVVTSATITNSNVNATAAITESKLSLNYSTSTLNSAIATKIPKFTIADENAIVVTDVIIDGTVKQAPVIVNPTTGSIDTLGAGPWSLGASVGANNLTVGGATTTVVIPGNLQIDGTSTTVNTSTLDVEDTNITVNKGGSDATSEGSGLTVDRVGTDGSLIYKNTSATKWAAGSLGSEVDLVGISSSQTLTNKTLTSPVMNDYMDINEEASPATPSAGAVRFYAKSDKKLYTKDSNGVEQEIGSGSGQGEKNYIENPSAVSAITGWFNVGDLDVARTTTLSELPREFTTGSGIKITSDPNAQSVADYVYYDFTLDDVDLHKKLKIEWSQKQFGAYVAGQLAVIITTQADRTTAIATPSITAIPAYDGVFTASFDTNSTATLSLVIRATADMATDTGVVISDVVVGPGQIVAATPIGNWTSYTPTGTWSTNTTYSGQYKRVGDTAEFDIQVILTGAPTAATLEVNLPSGLTLDLAKMGNPGTFGTVVVYDDAGGSGASRIMGYVGRPASGSTSLRFYALDDLAATDHYTREINATTPITFANLDRVIAKFSVPIAEWAGAPNYAGQNDVEYAAEESTWAASGSTTVYGPQGSAMGGALGASRTKTITWQTPIQPTDRIQLWVSNDRITWVLAESGTVGPSDLPIVKTLDSTGALVGGVHVLNGTAANQTRIRFARYMSVANDDAPANEWPSSAAFWVVTKARAGAAVGFGAATSTSMGLIAPYNSASLVHSGTYTPTLTNLTNVDASTAFQLQYMRVGASVTVSGIVNIDPSASGAIDLRMSLPPGLNMSADATTPAGGTAVLDADAGNVLAIDKASTTTVRFTGTPTTRTNSTVRFIFMYRM